MKGNILKSILVVSLLIRVPIYSSTLETNHPEENTEKENTSKLDENQYKTMDGLKLTRGSIDLKKASYRERMANMASWGVSFVLFTLVLSVFTKTSDVSQTVNPTKADNGGSTASPTIPSGGAGGLPNANPGIIQS